MDNNKEKIIIVEDDKFLRDLLVSKLEMEGFETITAVNGQEGLDLIKQEMPQIVLLDLVLPEIDGFEVLRQIKEDVQTNKIPVIILSNLGQQEEIERCLKMGAADYMIKAHFTPEEIVGKIKKVLGQS